MPTLGPLFANVVHLIALRQPRARAVQARVCTGRWLPLHRSLLCGRGRCARVAGSGNDFGLIAVFARVVTCGSTCIHILRYPIPLLAALFIPQRSSKHVVFRRGPTARAERVCCALVA
jgi:hypothetical protein